MTSYVADGNRPGFEQWARKNNLKEAAKTFSYLSQHNLLNYEEFQNHISDLKASIQSADNQIRQTQQAIQIRKSLRGTVKSTELAVMWFVLRRMLRTKHSTVNNIRQNISCMMSL